MSSNNPNLNEVPESDDTGSERVCQKCGAALESINLGTVCSACLMQVGFESDANAGSVDATTKPTGSDEAALNEDDSLEAVQNLFPGLEILELIGRGGMGIVYKARQTHLGRLVALKLLRAKCSGDPSLAERFTREARALAKLSHPNIVGVHDFGQAGDRPYLIMEYVDGVNLRSMLENKTLNPVEAMAMVPAVCEALQFAHDEGVVHRDIKPENILVDRRGRVRIADFGLARLMTRSKEEWTLTGTRQVMGTPHYMAPEQIEHPQEVDHRADIYSLGVVIYEMLTGELPIGRFELPSSKINVDIRFDDIVLRTLEKEPTRRYQHVTEVQTAVERIASDANLSRQLPSEQHSGNSVSGEPIDAFVKIAAFGVFAAAIVDAFIAIAMYSDAVAGQSGLFLGGTYHLALAGVLGFGGWQMLNHGPKLWQWTPLLAILPIHFGVLAAWPFAILYLILFLIGFRLKSTVQLNEKLALEFRSKSSSLNDGLSIALSAILKCWQRISSWLGSTWPVIWRKAVRGVVIVALWFAICALASVSLYWFYGRSRFPTILRISDLSARNAVLLASDEVRMRIDSVTARDHIGYAVKPDDLKRSQVQCSLYLAADRPDLRGKNARVGDNKVYLSEAFVAQFTSANAIEYEILFPSNVVGTVVEPGDFKSKPNENLKPGRFFSPNTTSAPLFVGSDNLSPRELNSFQYRPTLANSKPIEKWLSSAGMPDEQAAQTAAGLYELFIDLASTGGIVPNETGDSRLRPIADMLDKNIFAPQSGTRISVILATQLWAVETWMGTTVAVCVLGIVSFFALKFSRMHATRSGSTAPISMTV
ncbi:MAG: serine/threonine-protein kinase [Pirellula sp.]